VLKKTLNEFITQLKINLESKNYIESISLLLSAIEQYPKEYNLKLNLGNVYKLLGKTNDAINTYNSLLQTPLESIAHNNLSLIQLENGDYKKSIQHAREALKIDGNYNDARYNLAIALFENKEFKESLSLCVKLKEDNFYSNKAYELKCRIQQLICDWSEYDENNKLLRSNQVIAHPFLHISSIDDEESNYNNSLLWNNEGNPNYIERYDKYNSDKVNLGFFCGEIRNHPTFYLIKNLFKNLNRDIFSVYMFSYNHTSDEKKYIEKDIDGFIDITSLSTNDAKEIIKKHQLDVLIDLTTIISHNRSEIIEKDLSKIIISYLAFPGTTGSNLYDYVITDEVVTPLEQQRFYSERFLYMPNTYQINNGEINFSTETKKNDFNLPNNQIILGCLNQSFKLDPIFFDIWVNILEEFSKTCLWILNHSRDMQENIYKFINNRVDQERIIFADRVDYVTHLKRIQHIDIALDTRIYNGHTTTIEMLQAGIPLITLKGNHFASRVSASILKTLEIEELITKDYDDYKNKIVSLINNEKRQSMKVLIKNKLQISKLLDVNYFTKNFEKIILDAISKHF
jgi:protein O-GlcNAc transferase